MEANPPQALFDLEFDTIVNTNLSGLRIYSVLQPSSWLLRWSWTSRVVVQFMPTIAYFTTQKVHRDPELAKQFSAIVSQLEDRRQARLVTKIKSFFAVLEA